MNSISVKLFAVLPFINRDDILPMVNWYSNLQDLAAGEGGLYGNEVRCHSSINYIFCTNF